jgi:uncharacterized membrane protein
VISAPLTVFFVLSAVVVVAIALDERFRWAKLVGSAMLVIVLGGLLSNMGILPRRSPTYEVLSGFGVNIGIVLILLGVDVRSVVRAGPRMGAAFALGAVGTVVGVVVGVLALHDVIGPEAWKVAGQYTGTYIGGGVNMVAIGQALGTSPDVFSAAIAADNVTTALWMLICLAVPIALARLWPAGGVGREGAAAVDRPGDRVNTAALTFSATRGVVTLRETALVVAIGVGVVWLSDVVAARVSVVPQVLWLTTFALVLAQWGAVRRLSSAPLWGYYFLHLFFGSLGAQSVIAEIVKVGPGVFYFTIVIVLVHGLLLFGGGRVLGLDLPTLAVASQANVGGPASAMALATARGYADRVLPGIAVGLVGYAIGNYAGLAVAPVVRGMLGG